jgi:hypothetical protein
MQLQHAERVCATHPSPIPENGPPFLALAVTSKPSQRGLRDAIRLQWAEWDNPPWDITPSWFVGRFALGISRAGADKSSVPYEELIREQGTQRDLLFVNLTASDRGTIRDASLGWWRLAHRFFPTAAYIAKCDDDTFIHIPRLLHHMRNLGCHPSLYLGAIDFGTFNTSSNRVICWSWTWDKKIAQRCEQSAGRRPIPFAAGALECLSNNLARHLATSSEVAAAVERVIRLPLRGRARSHEDVLIGQWLSAAPHAVSYVDMDYQFMHNLACVETENYPYLIPWNRSLVVHDAKTAEAQAYVHAIVSHSARPDWHACVKATAARMRARRKPYVRAYKRLIRKDGQHAAVTAHVNGKERIR